MWLQACGRLTGPSRVQESEADVQEEEKSSELSQSRASHGMRATTQAPESQEEKDDSEHGRGKQATRRRRSTSRVCAARCLSDRVVTVPDVSIFFQLCRNPRESQARVRFPLKCRRTLSSSRTQSRPSRKKNRLAKLCRTVPLDEEISFTHPRPPRRASCRRHWTT